MQLPVIFALGLLLAGCNYTEDAVNQSHDLVDIIVEIPAGTNAKWEMNHKTKRLEWEIQNETKRIVKYLGYPANYGMIPNTLLRKEDGGDGDPLDVILLGPAVERGSQVQAKLIGMLRLTDSGEQDDKLIAVSGDGPFSEIERISELDHTFPGVTDILRIWFTSYKGPDVMSSTGFETREEAIEILEAARIRGQDL